MKLTHETDPSHCAIKTLVIGHYKLLIFGNSDVNAAGKRQGIVVRYKVDKNNLEIYAEIVKIADAKVSKHGKLRTSRS